MLAQYMKVNSLVLFFKIKICHVHLFEITQNLQIECMSFKIAAIFFVTACKELKLAPNCIK